METLDIIERLDSIAVEFLEPFKKLDGMPLITTSGSYGDPLAYVTKSSDIDLRLHCTEKGYLDGSTEMDVPYELERVGVSSESPIYKVRNFYGRHMVDLWLTEMCSEDYLKMRVGKLESLDNLDSFGESTRHAISNIDDYIDVFVNATCYRDDWKVFDRARAATIDYFSGKRGELAKFALENSVRDVGKFGYFSKYVEDGSEIDLKDYNSHVARLVDLFTYVRCCSEDVPRTMGSIRGKRNIVLWDALDLDRNLINSCFSSDEDISESMDCMWELAMMVYDEASNMPELYTDRIRSIMENMA